MTVRSRQKKIRNLVSSINPLSTIEGRMTGAYTISPSGNRYHMSLPSRPKVVDNVFEYGCSCYNVSDPSGMPACRGNSYDTVCYHCIATLIARAERLGYEIIIPNRYESAVKIADKIDGCVIKLKSNQGDGVVWLVGKKVLKTDEPIVSASTGIDMMRGPDKEID